VEKVIKGGSWESSPLLVNLRNNNSVIWD